MASTNEDVVVLATTPVGDGRRLLAAPHRERDLAILAAAEGGASRAALAERHGLTRKWVVDIIRRERRRAYWAETLRRRERENG